MNCMQLLFFLLLAFWKHRENIKRLLSGTERKTYLSSKIKRNKRKSKIKQRGFSYGKNWYYRSRNMGTAFAVLLNNNAHEVMIWSIIPKK